MKKATAAPTREEEAAIDSNSAHHTDRAADPGRPSEPRSLRDKGFRGSDWGFTQVPDWLRQRQDLSAGAKFLWSILARFDERTRQGVVRPYLRTLEVWLGVDERTVQRYVTELVDAELLWVHQRGKKLSNEYWYIDPWAVEGVGS